MGKTININGRKIGVGYPVYIIAEMSANHCQDYEKAVEIILAAKDSGADAIKLQTYTPDTITIDCNNKYFQIKGTIWEGKNLYNLYKEAYTPWEWQPELKKIAEKLDIDFFSSPFDKTAVEFLEILNVPAYKIASFEIVDIPLLKKIASTKKPVIMSTGMATIGEIEEAVEVLRNNGCKELSLLKCTSSYPALPENANLQTMVHLRDTFNVPTGLSDHTKGFSVPIAAVALGASIVEKHIILSEKDNSPDSSFSMTPNEFAHMVQNIRIAEKSIGRISYSIGGEQKNNRNYRRSLFAVEDILTGEQFTEDNIRSIRPGYGLHTRYFEKIMGKTAKKKIKKGTPLSWDLIY